MAWSACRSQFGLCLGAIILAACGEKPSASPEVLYVHARTLLQLEKLDAAAAETERGLAAAQSGSKLAGEFRLLRAEILLANREAALAAAALTTAPPKELASPDVAARYHLCQAHICLLRHDTKNARGHLDEAQSLAAGLADRRLMAEVQLRRAALAIALGDSKAARQDLDQVLQYAEAHKDGFLRLSATGNIGYMLSHGGQFDAAVPWFKSAAAQAKALGTPISEARAIGNLGFCLFELGDLGPALDDLRWAEAHIEAAKDRYEQQIWLGNIANIEGANGDYAGAMAHYAKALDIARALGDDYWSAVWLHDLSSSSIERKDWDAAERFNNKALSYLQRADDPESIPYSTVNAGQIANGRARYNEAISIFKGVIQRPSQDVILAVEAHAGLAEAYAALHRDTLAIPEFQAAVRQMEHQQAALLDEEHKLSWFASVIRTYQDYLDFLMQRGKTLDALSVVQSSRGRVLNSRIGEGTSRPQIAPSDLQRIAGSSGSTLLVYFVGSRQSYAWAIDKNSIRNFQIPGEPELRRLVHSYDTFVQQLRDPLQEECSAGNTLYDLLIAPAHIAGNRVMLAPDGPLYSLNFASLPVRSGGFSHYWLEDAQISIVPSFDLVADKPAKTKPSLLLIGDPVTADPEFGELSYARQEISGIRQQLPTARQLVYSRERARPSAYFEARPQDFSWIHFVAHAAANQEEPLFSAVILSRTPGAEYRLFAKDVLKNPIHADLVTISGCRGAGAKVYEGEGLVGFSWAFLKSGARNVVAGLWDVNDRSTAELMTAFYGHLAAGAAPADALRAAQLAMAKSTGVYRKPYYWAPFEAFRLLW